MKTLVAALVILLGMTFTASAQAEDTLKLRPGQQLTAKKSKIKVKFISVLDDSRCPAGVNCVWAGNARIKIELSTRRMGSKIVEINTTTGPLGAQFDGWAIMLTSLTPHPKASGTTPPSRYRAAITIRRLSR